MRIGREITGLFERPRDVEGDWRRLDDRDPLGRIHAQIILRQIGRGVGGAASAVRKVRARQFLICREASDSTRRARSTTGSSTSLPSSVVTPWPAARAVSYASITRRARSTSAGAGREDLVDGGDLFGMDGHLAAKAQSASAKAVAPEALHVIEVGEYRVDRIGPRRSGGESDLPAREQQLFSVRRPFDAKARREILGAEQQRRDRRVGGSDLTRAQDRARRFKHHQQRRDSAAGGVTAEHPRDQLHETDGFNLRQQHAIESGAAAEELQIGFSVGRVNTVDSHQPQRPR